MDFDFCVKHTECCKSDVNVCVWQVTMADRAAAERACKDPNPIIDGRKANVNLAYLGAKPRGIATGGGGKTISQTLSQILYFLALLGCLICLKGHHNDMPSRVHFLTAPLSCT